jgi:hypothetical protein
MIHRWLADLVQVAHLGFILFVMVGGFMVLRWPRLIWLHIPTALWGAAIEFFGWICPLTPLENHFRRLGGEAGYEGDFIDRYITALIYPSGLTRGVQIAIGLLVVGINLLAYFMIFRRRRSLV